MVDESIKKEDLAGECSDHFEISISDESVRAKVILSACYLDDLLQKFLKIVLRPNKKSKDSLFDGTNAPLSTFSAKIDMLTRLGLLSDNDAKSLHLVRKIRNQFAHSLSDCSFDESSIKDLNLELHRLNDHATEERRKTFSNGKVGDFEKSVSWLIFWIKYKMQEVPSECRCCGSEITEVKKIKEAKPGETIK